MTEQLQALYDSEINWTLAAFYDGGFTWKLGDEKISNESVQS